MISHLSLEHQRILNLPPSHILSSRDKLTNIYVSPQNSSLLNQVSKLTRERMARWAEIASGHATFVYVRQAEYVRLHQTFSVPDIPGRRLIRSYSLGHGRPAAGRSPHIQPQGQRPVRSRCSASRTDGDGVALTSQTNFMALKSARHCVPRSNLDQPCCLPGESGGHISPDPLTRLNLQLLSSPIREFFFNICVSPSSLPPRQRLQRPLPYGKRKLQLRGKLSVFSVRFFRIAGVRDRIAEFGTGHC